MNGVRITEENCARLAAVAGGERLSQFVVRTLAAALGIELVIPRQGRKTGWTKLNPPKPRPKRERQDDPKRRTLLPGMPSEALTLPWREYTRVRRRRRWLLDEAKRLGVTVEEIERMRAGPRRGFVNSEAARAAQARSAAARHANALARYEALVPEALRAPGQEIQSMRRWHKLAKARGMEFEAYVARLVERRLARRALLAARAERVAAREAAKAERERMPKPQKPKKATPPKATKATAATKATKPPKPSQPSQPPPPKNDAGHPWHNAIRATPASVAAMPRPKGREALAKLPAPERTAAASRYRNCARCRHAGLFRCLVWPALAVDERHICPHFDCERDGAEKYFSEP